MGALESEGERVTRCNDISTHVPLRGILATGPRVRPSRLGLPSLLLHQTVCDGTQSVDFCIIKHLTDTIKIASPPNPRFHIAYNGTKDVFKVN